MSPLPCASARPRSCRRRGRHVRHAGKHAQHWSRNPTRCPVVQERASVWSSAYFPRPGLRISRKQRRLSVLQPTLPVHQHEEADPLRKESQRSQRQSRSLEQTMHTDISAPVPKFCAQKTSRFTGRSYLRAGGNHMGATLQFPL